jgi:hypothetical protein
MMVGQYRDLAPWQITLWLLPLLAAAALARSDDNITPSYTATLTVWCDAAMRAPDVTDDVLGGTVFLAPPRPHSLPWVIAYHQWWSLAGGQ